MNIFEAKSTRHDCAKCHKGEVVQLIVEVDTESDLGYEVTGGKCLKCGARYRTKSDISTEEILGL